MSNLPQITEAPAGGQVVNAEAQVPTGDFAGVAPSSKDMMIGGGALVALAILLFFIRGAYVNYLVGSLKRSPNNAGLAGWALYGFLFFAAAVGCVALVSKSYLTMVVVAPIVGVSMICLITCLLVSAKR